MLFLSEALIIYRMLNCVIKILHDNIFTVTLLILI